MPLATGDVYESFVRWGENIDKWLEVVKFIQME